MLLAAGFKKKRKKKNNRGIKMWYADRQNPAQMWRADFTPSRLRSALPPLLVIAWQGNHTHMTLIGGYKEEIVGRLLCE